MQQSRFFPYSWCIDTEETEITAFRIYGLDERNRNVCVRINDFQPFIYLELPDIPGGWTSAKAQTLCNKIDEILGELKPLTKKLEYKKKLYFASLVGNYQQRPVEKRQQTYPYLFLAFSSRDDVRALTNVVRRPMFVPGMGSLHLKIHEQDASPILQFVCRRDIPIAGWVKFGGKRVKKEEMRTTCDREFLVKWNDVDPLPLDDPLSSVVPKPKIMAMDIETNALTQKADAPNNKTFQMSCVVARHGDPPENYEKYLLTLGEPDADIVGDDVNIFMYKTEADLLLGYTDLVKEVNPNIIVGYNILAYDINYLIIRAKQTQCMDEFDQQGFLKNAHAQEKSIKWSSSAYKNQEFQYLEAEGRLVVDLLPLVQRDFKLDNYKLDTVAKFFIGSSKDDLDLAGILESYKLGMEGVADGATPEAYAKGAKALGVCGKYCIQDSVLVVQLMDKLQTWIGLTEMAKTCNVQMFTLYTAGQQVKVFSQVYRYCMYNNIVVEKDGYATKADDHYQGATVIDPIPGVYDRVISLDFASLYPSLIIGYNIDYSTLVHDWDEVGRFKKDDTVPDDDCHVMEWEDHVGCVHDPKIVRKNALTELINKHELKTKTLREKKSKSLDAWRKKEYDEKIKALDEEIRPYKEERSHLAKSKPKHTMCAKRNFRFLKNEVVKGVLPTVISGLLDARKKTRNEMKDLEKKMKEDGISLEEKNALAVLISVLNQRQLSYKVSANSMYGAMGVEKGYLPFMPGAMATTYMGRKSIKLVTEVIPEKYGGKLVYGDTDSNYLTFPGLETAAEIWDKAIHVASEVSKLFPKPMKIEFEDCIYWRYLILTKKRYMYLSCGRDGKLHKAKDKDGRETDDNKLSKKGVLLTRRDNSNFVRAVYAKIIKMIFDRANPNDVMDAIIDEINLLCSNSIPYRQFVITKAIGSTGDLVPVPCLNKKGDARVKIGDYMVPPVSSDPVEREKQFKLKNCTDSIDPVKDYYTRCLPAQVQLAEKMRGRGVRVDVGTRLEYVITDNGVSGAKQYSKIESADYFKQHKRVLKIDAMYYLKALANPLDQVLNIAYNGATSGALKGKIPLNFVQSQLDYRMKVRGKMMKELKALWEPKLVFTDEVGRVQGGEPTESCDATYADLVFVDDELMPEVVDPKILKLREKWGVSKVEANASKKVEVADPDEEVVVSLRKRRVAKV